MHLPWDLNTINDALDAVIGMHLQQKTCKTLCGKRVSETRIDRRLATRVAPLLADPDIKGVSAETGRIVCPDCFRMFQDLLHASIDAREISRTLPPLPDDSHVQIF